jgi:hypothetical protein
MPETVPRVKSKGSGKDNLASVLGGIRKTTDELDNVRTVKGAGCNEVGERESVEDWLSRNRVCMYLEVVSSAPLTMLQILRTDTKASTGYAVRNGSVPCQLWLVDGEMRAGRTIETLLVQDSYGCRCRDRFGFYATVSQRKNMLSTRTSGIGF